MARLLKNLASNSMLATPGNSTIIAAGGCSHLGEKIINNNYNSGYSAHRFSKSFTDLNYVECLVKRNLGSYLSSHGSLTFTLLVWQHRVKIYTRFDTDGTYLENSKQNKTNYSLPNAR